MILIFLNMCISLHYIHQLKFILLIHLFILSPKCAWSHKSCATVNYTLIGVEPHGPTRGVWPIATVTNDSQLHLVASSI